MKLGTIIRSYREEHNLSLDELSNNCGLSKGYISMLENGINPRSNKPIAPTLPTLNKIASGLKIDLDKLLHLLDSEQNINLSIDEDILVLSELEIEVISRFRICDEIDREMVLRILKIDKDFITSEN